MGPSWRMVVLDVELNKRGWKSVRRTSEFSFVESDGILCHINNSLDLTTSTTNENSDCFVINVTKQQLSLLIGNKQDRFYLILFQMNFVYDRGWTCFHWSHSDQPYSENTPNLGAKQSHRSSSRLSFEKMINFAGYLIIWGLYFYKDTWVSLVASCYIFIVFSALSHSNKRMVTIERQLQRVVYIFIYIQL